ncbi:MAG: tRNA (adenosine(37)-N6)-dimethylallyltransferase MiaA [Clostridia bacterium]|jgi:tRNA dimethylallyltransferase|nr:tRNA (adenosine(37)-N6)-dimethylallyltransferase MiaA [Clostridia bacterium]MDD3232144.1 tRNA (adenosine(37)-N6)-dimethylallyltransferase MiaA [Clostridia bacterium]MDD3862931.1 tRNA (adenosine(37)-N6)-dimethylallyltransferase MiaA [Clostridia bacterium]MDD4408999.1 tRNA (adenosine(37)-N6)-dimethylallyltransferase MiaA [Clostridia bacterium]
MSKKVIVILGATATGKSEFAIDCAEKLNGEIISADSMQIYKELNIGTAKIGANEMKKIPHYLINIKHFYENYNVWQFVKDCRDALENIFSKNKTPIIVGGTNLYIKALIENYEFNDIKRDEKIRNELNDLAQKNGINALYQKLFELSPEKAKQINQNDRSRLIRAVECAIAEKELENSTSNPSENIKYKKIDLEFKLYALDMPREVLYKKINERVDEMIKKGLLEEVKTLKENGLNIKIQAGKSIGYREMLAFLDREISYELVVEKIKQHSRNYAKRQYTWLRSMNNIIWLDALNREEALNKVLENEMVKFE